MSTTLARAVKTRPAQVSRGMQVLRWGGVAVLTVLAINSSINWINDIVVGLRVIILGTL